MFSLSDALKKTGFSDALSKLGLGSGSGSDGSLTSGSRSPRAVRAEGAGCTKMLDNWKKFNASADEGVPGNCSRYVMTLKPHPIYIGNDGQLNEEKITETIATLNEINTRLSRLLF